jgi:protein-L-isoaspartate(D-aspartate) O-methyltransferase
MVTMQAVRRNGVCLLALALTASAAAAQSRGPMEAARNKMVDEEIVGAGVKNPRVIQAMRDTPRHEFVLPGDRKSAYYDMALPIGEKQTISPPFIVAYMTESLDPQPDDKVLEIGTGSGYQAAVLSPLVREVYTIEIVAALGRKAAKTLERLRYKNVHVKIGDGYQGWPEHAPFDKIIVTCSPEAVPSALVEQLKDGGRMVIPVGERYQQTLYLMKKVGGKMTSESLQPTLFVPMTGKAEAQRQVKPDPTHPAIENGSFERTAGEPPTLVGWHYQRQLEVVADRDAPDGHNYVTFKNATPGRGSQALQGFGVDGRKVSLLQVTVHVRVKDIRPGQEPWQLPGLILSFFDDNRKPVGEVTIGNWREKSDWQSETRRVAVPLKAREAGLYLGLHGAVGEVSFDGIEVSAVKK